MEGCMIFLSENFEPACKSEDNQSAGDSQQLNMVSVFRLSRWIIDCGKICILSLFVELDLCEQLLWNQKFQGNHMMPEVRKVKGAKQAAKKALAANGRRKSSQSVPQAASGEPETQTSRVCEKNLLDNPMQRKISSKTM
ncbi:uncharacterized protein LOC119767626 [Culex quinquefasciatus]|uniref:uncharacterized protein LOC119767626 n=1 Tax=Culex quinquefasciatus TaxID=7176 RepID=UPI0018E3A14F|nr:uncharacterized protein LOC119767626 [Culex quinquefasciatus]